MVHLSLSLSLFIFEIGFHCISGCPGTHSGDQVDPELTKGSQFFDRGFCLPQSYSCSVPKKHTELYINYELVGLFSQASY